MFQSIHSVKTPFAVSVKIRISLLIYICSQLCKQIHLYNNKTQKIYFGLQNKTQNKNLFNTKTNKAGTKKCTIKNAPPIMMCNNNNNN